MGNKKMFITFSYASELKFLLKSLLLLFSFLTLLTLLPLSSLSTCLSSIATPSPPSTSPPSNGSNPATSSSSSSSSFIKRSFIPYGTAAYSLVLMSAYRTGPTTFSLTALSSKPLHVYSHPTYTCHWTPRNSSIPVLTSAADKILPDWGYGHVYTTVVLTCTFESSSPAVASGSGGTLRLHATSSGGDTKFNKTEVIEALVEEPTEKVFNNNDSTHYKYDYVYCGSSLYGDLSPQRIREWLAYHVNLFGEKSHFVLHDAGGVHEEVLEVIRPWMELGYVTLQDIREQERFDGYYHNQFLVVNDCLLRYKLEAKWIFFFDVDEYIYIPNKKTIRSVTDALSNYTQFTFEQMTMSNKLCLAEDQGRSLRKWGFEKLVYRDVKRGIRRDRKYAVQPRNVLATGVHFSQNILGKSNYKTWGLIKYFHYHGTISERNEPCREFVNTTNINFDETPYILENFMRGIASTVKKFELKMIGPRLLRTRQ